MDSAWPTALRRPSRYARFTSPANVVPWVGGAMATTVSIRSAMPCVFVAYRDWNPPSEWPTMSTSDAPVAASTWLTKAAISVAEAAIGRNPPTSGKPGYAP